MRDADNGTLEPKQSFERDRRGQSHLAACLALADLLRIIERMSWSLVRGAGVVSALAGMVLVTLATEACGEADGSSASSRACVDVSLECQPIVSPPTFDAIYANVLQPSCASGTGTCHGGAAAGGLDMSNVESAFQGLSRRARADAVGCSLVVQRLEASESSFRMPPGPTPLSEPQRCAVRQWIASGASR
jgi:hypothetical protein